MQSAESVCEEARAIAGKEAVGCTAIDIRDRKTIRAALNATISQFGGLDILINTAAIFPSSADGVINDAMWGLTLEVNVTANYMLTDEAHPVSTAQGIDGSIVLTSSANRSE